MAKSKHISGPWRVRTSDESLGSIETEDGTDIAQALEIKRGDHATRFANATLLASAPEMLETLRSVVNYINGYGGATQAQILYELRATIAKATGEHNG